MNSDRELIKGRFITPLNVTSKVPLVIMLTGDGPKGSNSLSWVNLPPKLAEKGISTLLFDFSGLGNSKGERHQLTLTKGISDFKLIHSELNKYAWIDFDNIGVLASSFGASVALHCFDIMNPFKVIGLKSPCSFLPEAYANEISKTQLAEWIKLKYCNANGYDLNVLFDPFDYNIYNDAKKIKTPCLITHGQDDEIVPISQSIFLNELLQNSKLITFENCDHGYSAEGSWDRMADIFIDLFEQTLIKGR